MNTALPKLPVIIAEDSARDREFLNSILSDYELTLVADGEQVADLIKQRDTQCIISDIQMPKLNGIELAKIVWALKPDTRIVFWSHYKDEIYLRSLSQIIPPDTVYGYILKDNTSEIINKAVHQVFHESQCWIDPKIRSVQARGQRTTDNITDAEYEVLIDIALGLTDNVIAQRHYLSRRGVQSRLKLLYQKLNIERFHNMENTCEVMNPRSRAVAIAFQRGLINSEEIRCEEQRLKKWLSHEHISV